MISYDSFLIGDYSSVIWEAYSGTIDQISFVRLFALLSQSAKSPSENIGIPISSTA